MLLNWFYVLMELLQGFQALGVKQIELNCYPPQKLNSYEVMLTNASTISNFNCDQTKGPVMAVISERGSDLTIEFDIVSLLTELILLYVHLCWVYFNAVACNEC